VPAHRNVPTHECIAYCLSAAAGECACPAHAADECIRHRKRSLVTTRQCDLLPNYFGHLFIYLLYLTATMSEYRATITGTNNLLLARLHIVMRASIVLLSVFCRCLSSSVVCRGL